MRRADRQLGNEDALEILREGTHGVLAINADDGYPYTVPMNYVYVDGCVWLHCAPAGRKLDLLRADNRVSFCVVKEAVPLADTFSTPRYSSVVARGSIEEITGETEKIRALTALIDKYASGDDYRARGREYARNAVGKTVVLRMTVAELSGKARR